MLMMTLHTIFEDVGVCLFLVIQKNKNNFYYIVSALSYKMLLYHCDSFAMAMVIAM